MTDENRLSQLEARLARLEVAAPPSTTLALHPAWSLALGAIALTLGYFGLGLPQHYYQPLFAALFLLLAYHRGFLRLYPGMWRWPMIALNFVLLMLVFKLLLGGGLSYPFDWLKVPSMQQEQRGEQRLVIMLRQAEAEVAEGEREQP